MKTLRISILLLVLVSTLLLPGAAFAKTLDAPVFDDRLVFGGTYTLREGEELDGNLLVLGGVATLEEGSEVNGDVIGFGGSIDANGEIGGNLIGLGASVSLGDTAVVYGDLIVPGSALHLSSNAVVVGQVIKETEPFTFFVPEVLPNFEFGFPFSQRQFDNFGLNFLSTQNILMFVFRIFAFSALAVLVVVLLPKPTSVVADAVTAQPVLSGGIGILTVILVMIATIVMTITCILIPVAVLVLIALGIAIPFGTIALGLEVGKRVSESFKQNWTPPLQAGVGTFILSLVSGVIDIIPCVGWIVPFLIFSIGLGAVILTRFGSQAYMPGNGGSASPIEVEVIEDTLEGDEAV
jgi:hypothetical protein